MKWLYKKAWLMRWVMNCWPPFLFTGIHIKSIADDFSSAEVQLTLRAWNKNAFGCHFGGSLFAMTDPFYVLLLIAKLGNNYIIWDKAADIDFIKPGTGKVIAHFAVNNDLLADIRMHTRDQKKYLPQLTVTITDQHRDTVAIVQRTLYVRAKSPR